MDNSIDKENAIAEQSAADFDAFEKGEVNQFSPGESGIASELNSIESAEQATQAAETTSQATETAQNIGLGM